MRSVCSLPGVAGVAMAHTIHCSLVVFSLDHGELSLYVVDNRLPSRPLHHGENLDDALTTLLSETIGQKPNMYAEQLYTTSDPVEKGSIVVVYMALVSESALPLRAIAHMQSSFLERDILAYALQRLRWKIEYTNAVYALLPQVFTLTELQRTYEAILGRRLDKRNFRKKILSLGMLKSTGKKRKLGVTRPAETYTFRTRTLRYLDVI